jgi:hypothetical protein
MFLHENIPEMNSLVTNHIKDSNVSRIVEIIFLSTLHYKKNSFLITTQ